MKLRILRGGVAPATLPQTASSTLARSQRSSRSAKSDKINTITSANRTIRDKSSSGPCAAYGGDKSKVSNITTITTIWLMNFVQVVFTPLKMEVSTLDAILAKSTSTSIVLV